MGKAELGQLVDELLNDAELRATFKRDPQAAAEQAGITLSDDDREAIESFGVEGMDDSELVARISKARA